MNKTQKIAVYSGVIPSTTFIERLIEGLADTGYSLLLFGIKRKPKTYSNSVSVVGYRGSRLSKGIHLAKYSFLLSMFKNSAKRDLDDWLRANTRYARSYRLKFYPVLYHQPDIFHIQWAKSLDDWIWVKKFGIKLVLSLRGAHINYSPIADLDLAESYKQTFPQVDAFHAVSKAILSEAVKYNAEASKSKVVYSGLPKDLIVPIKYKKKKNLKIVSVGRSHWKKGYSYALDALNIVIKNNLPVKYTIIGASEDIELLYQIGDLGLDRHVKILNSMDFEKCKAIIKESDVLLLPSVEEGIANVVLEAMALGTLVLTTDCGGMREVIEDNKNGFVVPIRNSKAIAEKIEHILSLSQEVHQKLLIEAQKTIEAQHLEEKMVFDMGNLYELANNTDT